MEDLKPKRTISPEHKEAVSRAHTGKVVSEETRKKISEKALGHKRNLGRVQSEETKRKMSHIKHVHNHTEKNVVKDGCKWCGGETL